MRLSIATITANTVIRPGVYLVELQAPQLVQAVQPGQYCMVLCTTPQTFSTDPLLRRPFFVHSVRREQGTCTLLVHVQGRGTAWLVRQQVGAEVDILGPLGHGWVIRPTVRTLLLLAEDAYIPALTLLTQVALEQELSVTLVSQSRSEQEVYPPALLPPEVEYHIVSNSGRAGLHEELLNVVGSYLNWADGLYCAVSRETLVTLYARFERVRSRHFAQGVLLHLLVCGSGACLACSVETSKGQKLVCRDGPVFDLQEIAR
jgi:dihydroorotate dehydrogenase electron transfer subunit